MISVYPVDIYDKNGNLTKIEYYDSVSKEFVIQAEWDDREEQISKNREEFRKWCTLMLKRLGYEVLI